MFKKFEFLQKTVFLRKRFYNWGKISHTFEESLKLLFRFYSSFAIASLLSGMEFSSSKCKVMLPGKQYHIYNRGNNKQPIFMEKENYYYFLKKFKQYLAPYVKVHAYCLMITHFHFLIEIKNYPGADGDESTIACRKKMKPVNKAFRDFFICYSKSINKKYSRTGALFQPKFQKKEINQRGYYTALLLYIHLNPVEAGYCKSLLDWQFSSYKKLCQGRETEAVSWFGNKKEFIKAHEDYFKLKSLG